MGLMTYKLFFMIATALIGISLMILLAFWIIKYFLFKSRLRRSNLESLRFFAKEVARQLGSLSPIGEETATAVVENAAPAVEFFRRHQYLVSNVEASLISLHGRALELLRQHDRELSFYANNLAECRQLLSVSGYIPYSQCNGILDRGQKEIKVFASKSPLFLETPNNISEFQSLPQSVEEHNREFVEKELARCNMFFDSLAKYRLDRQQRECCVIDEDAGLVVAGAGSGKTSVIMAKVAYLIKIRGIPPEDILLISFTNKAAKEMSDRIMDNLGINAVSASTFHKFGLQILSRFGDGRNDIADESLLKKVVHKALSGEGDFVPEDYDNIVKYLAYYFNPDQSGKTDDSLGRRIERERALNLQTLKSIVYGVGEKMSFNGERVKSLEEVLIANFLFLNGIEYEYEKPYAREETADRLHRTYRPDFYLPEFDVYLEHYGIDERGNPPPFFSEVEKEKYLDGMRWKRRLHYNANNKYVESFSWWNNKGDLFSRLELALKNVGVVFHPRDTKEVLAAIQGKARRQLDEFEKLVCSFISLFKSNDFSPTHFDELMEEKAETPNATVRQRHFLATAKRLYCLYQKELAETGCRDFNDMINDATRIISALARGTLGYKIVIVDEYQDVSVSRMRLLKAVVENSGAHLFCVGDDWQSIFRFAGSDVCLFSRFTDFFKHATTMKIENTYRNSQELLDIMGQFVMRNPKQMRKVLNSSLHCIEPIRLLFYDESGKNGINYHQALSYAITQIGEAQLMRATKILLLGRTKYDEARIAKSDELSRRGPPGEYVATRFPNLSFQFLTVHKAKGLEGDYVILLNADGGQMGFPNTIADDPVLRLVLSEDEEHEFAEERRLFYVALTRTRNIVFILAPVANHSSFIDELMGIGVAKPNIMQFEKTACAVMCPKCKTGKLVCKDGPHGLFSACSNYPGCDYRVSIAVTEASPRCPECNGFLVRRGGRGARPAFLGCTNYPYCKYTAPV